MVKVQDRHKGKIAIGKGHWFKPFICLFGGIVY